MTYALLKHGKEISRHENASECYVDAFELGLVIKKPRGNYKHKLAPGVKVEKVENGDE